MELKVKFIDSTKSFFCDEGDIILNALASNGIETGAACAGEYKCGKCKIKILVPECGVTESEKRLLTAEEIESGIRLACCQRAAENLKIELLPPYNRLPETKKKILQKGKGSLRAAIDLGTTTVAVASIDENGQTLKISVRKNLQSAYAADVIGRIKRSKDAPLTDIIRKQLNTMLREVFGKNAPESITVSANTTMLHLLFGEDCEAMGVAPYTPGFLGSRRDEARNLGIDYDCQIISLPCISAFAGADLVAGIILEHGKTEGITLLLDLGTNAEIALFDNTGCIVTSAAAGPAFEGGCIKQGMGAIPGAISSFDIENGQLRLETIGKKIPIGICGSGLIDIVAALLREGMIDETGRMECGEKYSLAYGISLFAQDVREVQLAKAAISAAAQTLAGCRGVGLNEIERVVLSGGLGTYINVENAVQVGLIPAELKNKTVSAGNSSLAGTIEYILSEKKRALAKNIAESASFIDLSLNPEFSQRYIENMIF